MPSKKRKAEDQPATDPETPARVTRAQASRLPNVPFHMTTRRSRTASANNSASTSVRTSAVASKNVSAKTSATASRRASTQTGSSGDDARPAKRTRSANREVENQVHSELQMAANENNAYDGHSYPTVPSVEDFEPIKSIKFVKTLKPMESTESAEPTESIETADALETLQPIARPKRKRRTQKQIAEDERAAREKAIMNGEQPQESDLPLKRTRARTRGVVERTSAEIKAVETDGDGMESEQPLDLEPAPKRRRGPPRAPPQRRKKRGRGRGRKRTDIELLDAVEDEPTRQKLIDRNKELNEAYKAIAGPHIDALIEIADRTINQLCKDPHAHENCPEYDEVMEALQSLLDERQMLITKEYELKKELEEKRFQVETDVINQRHEDHIRHVWHEKLSSAQHEYMELVHNARLADDDGATVMDENPLSMPAEHPNPALTRGYSSSYSLKHDRESYEKDVESKIPKNPAALSAFQQWPSFVRREAMRVEAGPSLEERETEIRVAHETEARNLSTLAQAGAEINQQFPEPNFKGAPLNTATLIAGHNQEAADALVMLSDQRTNPLQRSSNNFISMNDSVMSKRTTRPRSAAAKGKQRSGSLQGQRPLLPAPISMSPTDGSPMSPFQYHTSSYPQHQQYQALQMSAPPPALQPATYISHAPPPMTPQVYQPPPLPPQGHQSPPTLAVSRSPRPHQPHLPPLPLQPPQTYHDVPGPPPGFHRSPMYAPLVMVNPLVGPSVPAPATPQFRSLQPFHQYVPLQAMRPPPPPGGGPILPPPSPR